MIRATTLLCCLLFASTAAAESGYRLTEATNLTDFGSKFCAASREQEHIFVLPSAVFDGGDQIACDDGIYKLRKSEPAEDPGHHIYNIDPPHGVENGLDCDGKADTGMSGVAINCIPANFESADHSKS